jgi:hypothetical protein
MELLHLLPDAILHYVVNGLLILGIVMTALSFFALNFILRIFPPLSKYHLFIQILSVIILATGLYAKGGYSTEIIWREEVKRLEKELEVAKNKAKDKIIEIEEKIIFKDRIIREKGENLITYIDKEIIKKEEIVKYIEICPVPNELIELHNQAAKSNRQIQESKK